MLFGRTSRFPELVPGRELFVRRDHHLEEGPEAVVYVHHRQPAVRLEVASVTAGLQRVVKNLSPATPNFVFVVTDGVEK
jgi:hypothetical protein